MMKEEKGASGIDVNSPEYRALLYDFYGGLLTDMQRKTYADHVMDDLTVSEIAQNRGVSRQAASDLIKRTEKLLAGYESSLRLVERFLCIKEKTGRIAQLAESSGMTQIAELAGEILEEL